MTYIEVDREKLEFGLEEGISRADPVFAAFERRNILRYAPCGLVSSAIHEYLTDQVIEAKQYLSVPRLSFDYQFRHVFPTIEVDDDPLVLDASYSQILRFAGSDRSYGAIEKPKRLYPPEKIAIFRFSARDMFFDWLTEAALIYQEKTSILKNIPKVDGGHGPLYESAADDIKDTIKRIYDTRNLYEQQPSKRVKEHGVFISRFIADDVVRINPVT